MFSASKICILFWGLHYDDYTVYNTELLSLNWTADTHYTAVDFTNTVCVFMAQVGLK